MEKQESSYLTVHEAVWEGLSAYLGWSGPSEFPRGEVERIARDPENAAGP
jgi:hypothetical protein